MKFPALLRVPAAGFCVFLATCGLSRAQTITVDGTLDSAYGSPLSVQAAPTGFGDNTAANTSTASGSELDAAYGTVSGGMMYLFLAGNLESNYNDLEIFVDTGVGGQNTLLGTNASSNANAMAGLKFDTAFTPFYYFTFNGGGATYTFYGDYATLPAGGGGSAVYLGNTTAVSNGVLSGGDNNMGVLATINNSNIAGVTTTSGTGGAAVTTGIEVGIPLSVIGNPTGNIRVSAFINGSGHNYLSNQVAGSLPSTTGNLGAPDTVDFSSTTLAGDQYFTVTNVPEPGSVALVCVGAAVCGIWRARRKR